MDEETEYGRKFKVDLLPYIKSNYCKAVKYYTIFLRKGLLELREEPEYFNATSNSQEFHEYIYYFSY